MTLKRSKTRRKKEKTEGPNESEFPPLEIFEDPPDMETLLGDMRPVLERHHEEDVFNNVCAILLLLPIAVQGAAWYLELIPMWNVGGMILVFLLLLLLFGPLLPILRGNARFLEKVRNGRGILAIWPYEPDWLLEWQESARKEKEQREEKDDAFLLDHGRSRLEIFFKNGFEEVMGGTERGLSWKGMCLLIVCSPFPPVLFFLVVGLFFSRFFRIFLGNPHGEVLADEMNYAIIHEEGIYFKGQIKLFMEPETVGCILWDYEEPWKIDVSWSVTNRFSGKKHPFYLTIPVPEAYHEQSRRIAEQFRTSSEKPV